MPTRLIRAGLLTSPAFNALTIHAREFYRNLLSVVDDWGRYDGHPEVLRPAVVPLLLHEYSIDKVKQVLNELCEAKRDTGQALVVIHNGDAVVLEVTNFQQQMRSKSRWPIRKDEFDGWKPPVPTRQHSERVPVDTRPPDGKPRKYEAEYQQIMATGKVPTLHYDTLHTILRQYPKVDPRVAAEVVCSALKSEGGTIYAVDGYLRMKVSKAEQFATNGAPAGSAKQDKSKWKKPSEM